MAVPGHDSRRDPIFVDGTGRADNVPGHLGLHGSSGALVWGLASTPRGWGSGRGRPRRVGRPTERPLRGRGPQGRPASLRGLGTRGRPYVGVGPPYFRPCAPSPGLLLSPRASPVSWWFRVPCPRETGRVEDERPPRPGTEWGHHPALPYPHVPSASVRKALEIESTFRGLLRSVPADAEWETLQRGSRSPLDVTRKGKATYATKRKWGPTWGGGRVERGPRGLRRPVSRSSFQGRTASPLPNSGSSRGTSLTTSLLPTTHPS